MQFGVDGGVTYYLEGPLLPWLWPALCLSGLAFQGIGLLVRTNWPIWAGLVLVLAGCYPERDITLATGALILSFALYYFKRKG